MSKLTTGKMIRGTMCLAAVLCVGQAGIVSAATKDLSNVKHIPAYMAPGTVIKYDGNKNMEVLREGEMQNKSATTMPESSRMAVNVDEDLPTITEGMTIVYDALGGPIIVGESGSDTISVDMKEINLKNASTPLTLAAKAGNAQSGKVSWFDIWKESSTASGQKADNGAAHKTIKLRSNVSVKNNDNKKNTSVKILDRGPYVKGRILDMSKQSFSKVESLNRGLFNGIITW